MPDVNETKELKPVQDLTVPQPAKEYFNELNKKMLGAISASDWKSRTLWFGAGLVAVVLGVASYALFQGKLSEANFVEIVNTTCPWIFTVFGGAKSGEKIMASVAAAIAAKGKKPE